MFQKLVQLPRNYKRSLMLSLDIVAIPLAFWLSFNLRLDFQHIWLSSLEMCVLALTSILTILFFVKVGLYRAVVRYIGMDAGWAVLKGAVMSTLLLASIAFVVNMWLPRAVPFIYFTLVLLLVGGSRFVVRQLLQATKRTARTRRSVAIYGAGAAGTQAMMSLLASDEYRPVLFVDDDEKMQGRMINGITVVGPDAFARLVKIKEINNLLLALPSVSGSRRREIIDSLSDLPVHVHTIPSTADLVSGKAKIEEIRDIQIEDLLGRDAVAPDQDLMHRNIQGKVVLVTGAGGSIGAELCRQILLQKPRQLILLDQSEYALYKIERELRQQVSGHMGRARPEVLPILGSVLDEVHLVAVLEQFQVQTIYHAAAYKHVPMVEHNIVSALRNNVFGTVNVAKLAERFGVETCVLVSTDKAVRPANVMGASKRFAELVFQACHSNIAGTRFSIVRFGNVLGSSGSVIPLFREQISNGGPVTVTHPDIIRYFMTIPEAAQLVIQAGAMARGGEVFVLDMGEPVKIATLARKMITLMGMSVKEGEDDGDVEIVYTGLRPGEKLYEELLIGEYDKPTNHPRVSQAQEIMVPDEELQQLLSELEGLCGRGDCKAIRDLLMRAPLGYSPKGPMEDLLYKAPESDVSHSQIVELAVHKEKAAQ